jgi:hypothetical protein
VPPSANAAAATNNLLIAPSLSFFQSGFAGFRQQPEVVMLPACANVWKAPLRTGASPNRSRDPGRLRLPEPEGMAVRCLRAVDKCRAAKSG